MLSQERQEQFKADVAEMKIGNRSEQTGGFWQIGGLVTMIVGIIGLFVAYLVSMGEGDSRNIQSLTILGLFFLGVTVAGGASYTAGAVTKALRLWLLRQLYDANQQTEELVRAIRGEDE